MLNLVGVIPNAMFVCCADSPDTKDIRIKASISVLHHVIRAFELSIKRAPKDVSHAKQAGLIMTKKAFAEQT